MSKEQTVKIEVSGGVVEVVLLPKGVRLEVVDYDVLKENGRPTISKYKGE